jgi:hypothetical protein
VAGAVAPLVRRRLPAPPVATQALAYAAPLALSVAARRTRVRDVAVCGLQMWAYVAAYKTPHDDEAAQVERVLVRYPILADRVLGLGRLPSLRLQRRFGRGSPGHTEWRAIDHVLVWTHWSWFMVPHGSVLYLLLRHPQRFPRGAALMYTVFNVGASFYWVIPTAPPWYAAGVAERSGATAAAGEGEAHGELGVAATTAGSRADPARARTPVYADAAEVRRLMVEYGEDFWRGRWGSLYSVFGGNPLAAMPSLHFATSLMAAFLLTEAGPLPGALGAAYTATLGFALVYLGEHYAADLLAGAALTLAVRRAAPRLAAPAAAFARGVSALEAIAHPA